MMPEQGDTSIRVEREDVRRAFAEAGAVPGDTVLLHGSLSSMGFVEGGPTTVLDGCLDAQEPGGTLAVPTLWFHGKPPLQREADFDPARSPAYNGALAEAMRCDPRSLRSHHFSHSVSAIGARASELTADHGADGLAPSPWSEKAFADVSPWARLYEWNALYGFIGVDMTVCTMKHYIESRYVRRLLSLLPEEERAVRREQLSKDCCKRIWPFYASGQMGELLERWGLVARARIGSATLRVIRARPLVDVSARLLWDSPEEWLAPEFLDWWRMRFGSGRH